MVFADDKFGLSELPFSCNYQSDALLWSDEEKKWSAVKKGKEIEQLQVVRVSGIQLH